MMLEELERELNRGLVRPVYLLLGPEDFLRRRALQRLKQSSLAPESVAFNYAQFSAPVTPLREVLAVANTFPVASPHRFVLVEDLDAIAETEREGLLAYIQKPQQRTVLVLSARDLDRRTSFYKSLKENACIVELAKLKGAALERWAGDFIRSRGYRISDSAVRKLVDLAGTDLQVLSNEIEKLLLYCGERSEIPDPLVEQLVRGSRLHSIFELTGSLGRRDKKAALRLLGNLMGSGESPLMIVTMMARHFRQVLMAKELQNRGRTPNEIAAVAQIPSFLLEDFLRQARAIDQETATAMYLRLAEADRRFKSTAVNERLFLEKIICAL